MHTKSTEDFLCSIDPDLCQYTELLVNKGFINSKILTMLYFSDIAEIPIGQHHLIINEVTKMQSSHSKSLLTSLHLQSQLSSLSHSIPNHGALHPLVLKELFPNLPNQSAEPYDHDIKMFHYANSNGKTCQQIVI